MTLDERARSYAASFPFWPPLHVSGRWLYGVWAVGNNYRNKSDLYGEYPPTYLDRVKSVFPDAKKTLHLFSGSVQDDAGICLDIQPTYGPDVLGDAECLPFKDEVFDLVMADPPYSKADAVRYGTKMIRRRLVMKNAARVTRVGGYLVWLDTRIPMFSKRDWQWFGTVGLVRSTNHRMRGVFMFQRVKEIPQRGLFE